MLENNALAFRSLLWRIKQYFLSFGFVHLVLVSLSHLVHLVLIIGLSRLWLMSYQVSQKIHGFYTKYALVRIQVHVVSLNLMDHVIRFFIVLKSHAVHVHIQHVTYLVFKSIVQHLLVNSPHIFEIEVRFLVTEVHCVYHVCCFAGFIWVHWDLIVTYVHIDEFHKFESQWVIHQFVGVWLGCVVGTSLVHIKIIDAHGPLLIFFFTSTTLDH